MRTAIGSVTFAALKASPSPEACPSSFAEVFDLRRFSIHDGHVARRVRLGVESVVEQHLLGIVPHVISDNPIRLTGSVRRGPRSIRLSSSHLSTTSPAVCAP